MFTLKVSEQLAYLMLFHVRVGDFKQGEVVSVWFDRQRQLVALRSRNWSQADEEMERERRFMRCEDSDDFACFVRSCRLVRIPDVKQFDSVDCSISWDVVMLDVARLARSLSGDWQNGVDVYNYNICCKGF